MPYSGIAFRLAFLFLIATLSIWASYESSKGFAITVLNQAPDSPAGKRFDLFYVSNDKATRVVLNASNFVEHLLYLDVDGDAKKPVSHVTLRLAAERFPGEVDVLPSGEDPHGFVIDVSPQVMEVSDLDRAVTSAVLRGMARVWLWDGQSAAPPEILSGAVEYIATAAGFGGAEVPIRCGRDHGKWFEKKDPRAVARLLGFCEEREEGFIRRLNGAMRSKWHDRTVDDALGKEAGQCLCVPADRDNNISHGYLIS